MQSLVHRAVQACSIDMRKTMARLHNCSCSRPTHRCLQQYLSGGRRVDDAWIPDATGEGARAIAADQLRRDRARACVLCITLSHSLIGLCITPSHSLIAPQTSRGCMRRTGAHPSWPG